MARSRYNAPIFCNSAMNVSKAVGDKLLGNLLHAGWIERSPDLNTGDLYRITEAGRIAFRTPVPIK